ncbi:hypothetical protein BT69DRAFT_1284869, partial [Atractiella rhizophila]
MPVKKLKHLFTEYDPNTCTYTLRVGLARTWSPILHHWILLVDQFNIPAKGPQTSSKFDCTATSFYSVSLPFRRSERHLVPNFEFVHHIGTAKVKKPREANQEEVRELHCHARKLALKAWNDPEHHLPDFKGEKQGEYKLIPVDFETEAEPVISQPPTISPPPPAPTSSESVHSSSLRTPKVPPQPSAQPKPKSNARLKRERFRKHPPRIITKYMPFQSAARAGGSLQEGKKTKSADEEQRMRQKRKSVIDLTKDTPSPILQAHMNAPPRQQPKKIPPPLSYAPIGQAAPLFVYPFHSPITPHFPQYAHPHPSSPVVAAFVQPPQQQQQQHPRRLSTAARPVPRRQSCVTATNLPTGVKIVPCYSASSTIFPNDWEGDFFDSDTGEIVHRVAAKFTVVGKSQTNKVLPLQQSRAPGTAPVPIPVSSRNSSIVGPISVSVPVRVPDQTKSAEVSQVRSRHPSVVEAHELAVMRRAKGMALVDEIRRKRERAKEREAEMEVQDTKPLPSKRRLSASTMQRLRANWTQSPPKVHAPNPHPQLMAMEDDEEEEEETRSAASSDNSVPLPLRPQLAKHVQNKDKDSFSVVESQHWSRQQRKQELRVGRIDRENIRILESATRTGEVDMETEERLIAAADRLKRHEEDGRDQVDTTIESVRRLSIVEIKREATPSENEDNASRDQGMFSRVIISRAASSAPSSAASVVSPIASLPHSSGGSSVVCRLEAAVDGSVESEEDDMDLDADESVPSPAPPTTTTAVSVPPIESPIQVPAQLSPVPILPVPVTVGAGSTTFRNRGMKRKRKGSLANAPSNWVPKDDDVCQSFGCDEVLRGEERASGLRCSKHRKLSVS